MAVPTRTVDPFVVSVINSSNLNPHVLGLANGQFDIAYVAIYSASDNDSRVVRFNADGTRAYAPGDYARPPDGATNRAYDPSLASLGTTQVMAFASRDQSLTTNEVRLAFYSGASIDAGNSNLPSVVVNNALTLKTDVEVALMA